MEIIKNKTKVIIISIFLVTVGVLLCVKSANAATLAEPVDFEREGCDTIQEWVGAIQSKRQTNVTLCGIIKSIYKQYLDEEDIAELDKMSEDSSKSKTLDEANSKTVEITEFKNKMEQKKSQKIAEAEAKKKAAEEAAKRQEQAKDASNKTYNSSISASYSANNTNNSTSSYSWSGSARDFIVSKESGGNYSATNGRYYGAYQLDISYLNGDLSQENQDRVAENYVNNRYGGWDGAMSFWQSHGWY